MTTEYDEGQSFIDHIDGEVDAFFITDVNDNTYEIREFWERPGGTNRWQRYHMSKKTLDKKESRGFVEEHRRLSEDELDAVDAFVDADTNEYGFVKSVYGWRE